MQVGALAARDVSLPISARRNLPLQPSAAKLKLLFAHGRFTADAISAATCARANAFKLGVIYAWLGLTNINWRNLLLYMAEKEIETRGIVDGGARQAVPADEPEPRWPALFAALAVAGLYIALPPMMTFGPRWLFPTLVLALLIPTVVSHRVGHHRLNTIFGSAVTGVLTVGLVLSLGLLVRALPSHRETPEVLLRSAAALWITNILVFALWYWRLDAGGPHQRDKRAGHPDGAILFPQMTMSEEALREAGLEDWSPNFIDYLFLAFNASTALSPTDAPVLARWAKVLMMLQALLSLTIIVLLAARAVNIL